MSTIIMSACWPLQGMSPAQKSVLISLADNANDEGVCWPSIAKICERTCLSERAVRNALRWLESAGVLASNERTGRSTWYTIRPNGYHPGTPCPPAGNAPLPGMPCPPPRQEMPPTPAPDAPRTVIEPSGNHQGTASGASAALRKPAKFDPLTACPDNVTLSTWVDWCQHRREIRKPLTAKSCEQQAKALAGHPNPDEVLRQSIANGWTGVFPEKVQAPTNVRQFPQSRHTGFDDRDYTAGLTMREDGTYAF